MKVAELRQSILQAAVQGKLLPHNPQDEPASELLKRIQQNKAQLVKEGKLKKEKPLPPVSEDEVPFDLPEGWVWCRLGEIGFTNIGLTYKPSDISKTGVPVLRSGNIQNGKIDYSDMIFVSCSVPEKLMIKKGDILICARNGSKRLVGKSAIVQNSGMSFGAFMAIFRSSINSYVHIFLQSPTFFQQMHGNASDTTTINQITQNMLKNALLPLAPEATQQRIIDKLEELMFLCDELEAEEKKRDALEAHFTEYLPKAILQTAVQGKLVPQNSHDESASELLKRIQQEKSQLIKEGKFKKEKPLPPISEDEIPYDLPEGWVWCKLGSIIQFTENNNIQSTLSPDDIVNYVDIDSIDNRHFVIRQVKQLPMKKLSTRARRILRKDYIIYSLVRPYLNNLAVVTSERKNFIGSTGFAVFKPILISNKYIMSILLSPYIEDYFRSLMSGFNSPSISQTDFINTPIPIAPLAEQQRIVAKVDELMALCEKLKTAYTAPISLDKTDNIIPFPAAKREEETLLAARGDVGQLSNEAIQAFDDLFAGDEE